MRNFVLIGAPARVGGEVMGSLAVIGPTRIDYQHTMTAVSYIARLFDKILERIGVSNCGDMARTNGKSEVDAHDLDTEHELPASEDVAEDRNRRVVA